MAVGLQILQDSGCASAACRIAASMTRFCFLHEISTDLKMHSRGNVYDVLASYSCMKDILLSHLITFATACSHGRQLEEATPLQRC